MRGLLILLLVAMSTTAEGLEIYGSPSPAPTSWTLLYNEDQKWVVQRIGLDAEGWPVLKSKRQYKEIERARWAMGPRVQTMSKVTSIPEDGKELIGPDKNDSLWPVTNQWSWDWEVKFAQWVQTELDRTWWTRHRLATDCADVAYSARWIFARNNGLPMANRLGNGQWFTNRSVKPEWKRLPSAAEWHKDKRFLAALNYFLDFVFTHSLWQDSYPVAINAAAIIPGAHHLSLTDTSGHTQFIHKVGLQPDEIPILTLNSTIPREVRDLSEYLFFGDAEAGKQGIVRFRWPKASGAGLIDGAQMPHYSPEQFGEDFVQAPRTQFWEEVFHRINPGVDFDRVAVRALTQVRDLMQTRLQIVEDGYRACSGGRCPKGSASYELHSTPTRDGRIAGAIDVFGMLQRHVRRHELILPLYETEVLTQEGYTFNLLQLMTGWRRNMYSSDPGDEPVTRWGIHPRAASERIRHVYEDGMNARTLKMDRGGRCRMGGCAFGSADYIKESTFEEDMSMWKFSDYAAEYCGTFEREMCEDLSTRLTGISLTAAGRTQGIRQWMEESLLFNSDPRQTRERRWFGFTHEIPHFTFHVNMLRGLKVFDGRAILTSQALIGTQFGLDTRIWTLNGMEYVEWTAPAGEQILDLDTRAGWVWLRQGPLLRARQLDSGAQVHYTMSGDYTSIESFAGRALIVTSQGAQVLRIDPNGVVAEAQVTMTTYAKQEDGLFALVDRASGTSTLLDLDGGALLPLPPNAQVSSIVRDSGFYLVRFLRAGGEGTSCAVVSRTGGVVLNHTGDCLNVHAGGSALFVEDGNLVHRTYDRWNETASRNLGVYAGTPNPGLFYVNDAAGTRTYCMQTAGLADITALAGGRTLYACNDRYVILYAENGPWRIVDLTTKRQVFEAGGWIIFATKHEREHFIIARDKESLEIGVFDLERPQNGSMMSDYNIWQLPVQYGRQDGIFLFKSGNGVYMKSAL